VTTYAEGDTFSNDTGVGISVAVSVVNYNALSTTSRDIAAIGALEFSASNISGQPVAWPRSGNHARPRRTPWEAPRRTGRRNGKSTSFQCSLVFDPGRGW
jgi:hypothetical protein